MTLKSDIGEFETVRRELMSLKLPVALETKVCLAVEEAFINVVSYSGSLVIDVVMAREGDTLTVTITDEGKAFDPTAAPHPIVDIDNLKPGGLGIELVKRLMDTVSYRRENDKNVLTLTKFV